MRTEVPAAAIHEPGFRGIETAKPTEKSEEITLFQLLIVLAERKRLIFAVGAIFAVLAVIVSLLLPQYYTATTTILPPQQNSSLGSALASQLGNLGGVAALAGGSLGMKSPTDMIVALMKSRTVEDGMVQRFHLMQEYHAKLASDGRKDLERYVKIDGAAKDGMIRVSVEDRDPKRASELANGYVDQFRKLSEHLAITEASQRRLFFEQQLETAKNNLADAEESLKVTEQKTGLIQLDSQARALIESAAQLRAEITAKEVQIRSMETFATSENAQIVQAQQELEGLKAQLAELGGSETVDENLIVPRGKVTEASIEYVGKLRNVKYYETIFDILARQYEVAKLDEAKQGALIQVVDPAVPPDRRSFPKRGIIVIVSTVLGFMVGIVIALAKAMYENLSRVPKYMTNISQLRKALSLRPRGQTISSSR
ncbi:MAG TPA: Wzz/FepE/Etk N-terminal domain-containing protein [Terracidiphilus sp.]|nr:Wzz/FepE/Etk N-terminal domain-containing protein [Terracidiphilus sp.]